MSLRNTHFYRFGALLLTLPLLALTNCISEPEDKRPSSEKTEEIKRLPSSTWERTGFLGKKRLNEISGLAPSYRASGVYWSHNDAGNDPELHAINEKGELLGSVEVKDVPNVDWEDIASFEIDGQPYLLLGDIGDNNDKRSLVSLHLILEPEPDASGEYKGQSVSPVWDLKFRYEGGPTDCESLAVDVSEGTVYLLNKHKRSSIIYSLPLEATPPGELQQARQVVPLRNIANSTSSLASVVKAGLLGDRATAMDFRKDRRMAAVLTYTDVRLYERQPDETWRDAFLKDPTLIALPDLTQPEALCFTADGKGLLVTSEGESAPVYRATVPELD